LLLLAGQKESLMKHALILTAVAAIASISVRAYAETATYQYDALGRLTKSFKQGGGADGVLTTIAHDAADNRSNYSVVNVTRTLHTGDRVYSADNRFYLTLKANGQLAVVTAATSVELWNSGTTTLATDRANFNSDGNLALLNASSMSLWNTSTAGHPASQLAMQNDGNLTIKDPAGTQLWQTNTGGH
jgi:hypothetical protein